MSKRDLSALLYATFIHITPQILPSFSLFSSSKSLFLTCCVYSSVDKVSDPPQQTSSLCNMWCSRHPPSTCTGLPLAASLSPCKASRTRSLPSFYHQCTRSCSGGHQSSGSLSLSLSSEMIVMSPAGLLHPRPCSILESLIQTSSFVTCVICQLRLTNSQRKLPICSKQNTSSVRNMKKGL